MTRKKRDIKTNTHRAKREKSASLKIEEKSSPIKDTSGISIDITKRNLAEEAIARLASEEKLTLLTNLINKSNDAVFIVDPETNGVLELNDAACSALGYSREELLSMKVIDLAETQSDYFHWKEHIREIPEKESLLLEDRLRRKDGTTFPVEVNVKHVAHDKKEYLVAVVRDITERKEIENRINASNALLKLFSHTHSRKEYLDAVLELIRKWSNCRCVGIRVLDEHENIPYESYIGFSKEFRESENWLSLKNDQCVCIRIVTEKPDYHEVSVMTSDGSFYCNNTIEFVTGLTEEEKKRYRGACVRNGFVSVAVIPIRYRRRVLGAIHLADEREERVPLKTIEFVELMSPLIGEALYRFSIEAELRRNYEALQRSEASLSEAQRIAHLGNWNWDMQTNELQWSDGIYQIYGLPPRKSGMTYVTFLNYVHPDDREFVKKAINEAIHEKKPYNIEHRIVLPDVTVRTVHEQGEVKFDDTGEPIRMVGTIQDITERKKAEEELTYSREQLRNLSMYLQSAREEERTNIAREIHDELGQVLTALKMDLSWLVNKCKNHEPLFEKTRSMLNLVDSTIQTVKRISAELRPGVLDHLGLAAAIEWQAKDIQDRTGIICDVNIHPEDIILDRHHSTTIFRIFQEALTNVVRHAKATEVKIQLEKRDSEIVLNVSDNGKGITKKQIYHPRSFGLIGMRERVHFLGGEVSISGVRNKGTSINISIPLKKM